MVAKMIPRMKRTWNVGVWSLVDVARTTSICNTISNPSNIRSKFSRGLTSSNSSSQKQRSKNTKHPLRRSSPYSGMSSPPMTMAMTCTAMTITTTPVARPLPSIPLPILSLLLQICRHRGIAQVRMIERRKGSIVEQRRLMSQVLHRTAVARRRRSKSW